MSVFLKKPQSVEIPSARAGHSLLHHRKLNNESIIVVGGYNEAGPLAEIWIYNLSRSIWSEIMGGYLNRGPLPRVDFDTCIMGNKIYLFGGMESDGQQALIYNDLWCFDLGSRSWTRLEEEAPVSERMGHVCVALDDDHMIVHGGECLGKSFNDTWLYTASSSAWQRVHDNINLDPVTMNVPCARSSHVACNIPNVNKVALFGGCTLVDGEPSHMNDFWLLDTSPGFLNVPAWTWSRKEGTVDGIQALAQETQLSGDDGLVDIDNNVFPSPRDMPAMVPVITAVGPKILILGGYGLQEVEEDEIEEEIEMETSGGMEASKSDVLGENTEDIVTVGYLSDVWTVDMGGTCVELGDDDVLFVSGEDPVEPAWGCGGAKRGSKLVSTSQGILSFGGFDGNSFCGTLERIELTFNA